MNGYIDMHCDTLMVGMRQHKGSVSELNNNMLDIRRLKTSGCAAQFFAMFLPQFDDRESFGLSSWIPVEELIARMHAVFTATLSENSDCLAFAGSYEDMKRNSDEGKISAFLTMENGFAVDGKFENLERFHESGVRLITLTWNDPNCFGYNHSSNPALMNKGLTAFGKDAVRRMNELGIIVDVSHLSDGGFRDVADCSGKPFVASHSNCRELSPATRNLTDDMIRTLADHGGAAGLNLAPDFLNKDTKDMKSRVSRLCDHAEHFIKIGGREVVGIGTDFDGISGDLEIADCTCMRLLFEEMDRRGFSDDLIDLIRFGNMARVIRDTMK